jgi:hypothetical protein
LHLTLAVAGVNKARMGFERGGDCGCELRGCGFRLLSQGREREEWEKDEVAHGFER